MSNPPAGIPNPYVGPRSFRVGERLYGRKREANQLLNLIVAERIVLLHSPSGAGKTSLIHAALIPRLEKMRFQVLPVVRVNLDVSDTMARGFECNRYVFSTLLSLEEDVPEQEKISAEWLAKMSLSDYLEKRFRPEGSMDVEVLIFDQFEEILTLDPTDQSEKEEFFKQVGEALEAPNRWALFAIRDDFVASLDPYLVWIPNRLSINFRLDLLGIDAARRAIQEPARSGGVEFEDEAAGNLIDDLRRVRVQQPDGSVTPQLGPYVEPVQLQVVCYRIWEDPRPDPARITAAELAEFDSVDQSLVDSSLADYYARRVDFAAQETGTKERAIREWIDRRLITEQGLRGTVLMGSEESGGLDNSAIKLLVDAHLVRAEKRGGATWYELSHDRLLEPVRENNIAWLSENLSLLQRQADLWNEEGRKEGVLLEGEALDEAQQWALDNEAELSEVDREFLNASLERSERIKRERELEQEQLQAAQDLAEEQTRSARRARRWTIAISILVLLTVAVAVVAIMLFIRSSATSNFIEAIVDCEGEKYDRCVIAAKAAAAEEEDKYFLLVVQACEDGLRAAPDSPSPDELFDAAGGACEQVIKMSNNLQSISLPLLNDLCENLWYTPGAENVSRKICNQAVKLASASQNLSRVFTTCAIGKNFALKKEDIDNVCKRAVELVTTSTDLQPLADICGNYTGGGVLSSEDIQKACDRYNTVALASTSPKVLRDFCMGYSGIAISEQDRQKACNQAVELLNETPDPFVARDLCLSGPGTGISKDAVQRACQGYQELSIRQVETFEDPYVLSDMCLSRLETGLSEEVIQAACGRAVDLAVETGDSYIARDICISGREAGISEQDVQKVCAEYQQLSITLVEVSEDAYVLSDMCLYGRGANLADEVIRSACERAINLGKQSDDPYFYNELCLYNQDSGLTTGETQQSCDLAIELATQFEDPYILKDMCSVGLDTGLTEETIQAACDGYHEISKTLAETSEDAYVLSDICSSGREANLTDEVVRMACERAVDLGRQFEDPYFYNNFCLNGQYLGLTAGEIQQSCDLVIELATQLEDPYALKDMCSSGLDNGLTEDTIQAACAGYQEISITLVETSEDAYVLSDMCLSGRGANLADEIIRSACERAIDLGRQFDDPYFYNGLCLYSQDSGLTTGEIQQSCDLAIELATQYEDPYVLKDMCLFDIDAGLTEETIQAACAGYQAISKTLAETSEDAYVLKDICLTGRETNLTDEVVRLACERAVDLGSGFDDPYLLGELCLFDYAGDLSEENFHRVCEPVANQITPDEPRPVRVDPGSFEIFSFQGLEGQVLTITMTGMAENLNLNLVLLDPRGAHLFDEDVSGGDQTALIDQLQLAESGIYIIGVYNPDSFSSEFDLALILEEANG